MTRLRKILLGLLLALSLLAVAGAFRLLVVFWRLPTGLEYDGVFQSRVAGRPVTIETRSISLGKGDDGDADIIVSAAGVSTKLHSRFSKDMWTFIRPAYVSWQNVDSHSGSDLVIWKPRHPTQGPLQADEYISSEDGQLHTLAKTLETDIPGLW